MCSHNDENDNEMYADNLSDCPDDNDCEVKQEYESNDETIPGLRRFLPQIISKSTDSLSSDEDIDEHNNPPILESFLGPSGLNTDNPESVSDAVNLFIGDDLFAQFVEESNRYYHQNLHKFKSYTNSTKWKDITVTEMKKFLGLIVLMGQVHKDRVEDYWTTDVTIETPFFSKTMNRDRFRQIWKVWHFSNNENIEQTSDRLFKVKPVIDYFLPKFVNVYKPHQEITLEEGIIPWRGRLFFRVYNASRIVKYGILVRMLCESATGYICNFQIYCAQELKFMEMIESTNLDPETVNKIINPTSATKNKNIKGVDRADQYLSYYSILRRTKKWTKRVAMYLLNCALFNAFIVYNSVHQTKITYKKFLHQVACYWVADQISSDNEVDTQEPGPSTSPTKRTPKLDPPGRLSMDMTQHKLQKIVSTGKKKKPQRQCRVCAAHKKRSQSCYICRFCGVPLHVGECFERYHTMKNY